MGVQRSDTTPTDERQRPPGNGPSVTVTVRLLGELRSLAGRREVVLQLPVGSTMPALASELGRACDPAFAGAALSADGDLQSHVAVFLNGIQVSSADGTPTPLGGGEVELMLVPMYEGG